MTMKPCRECRYEIASLAPVCPHCGVKDPVKSAFGRWIQDVIRGLIAFFTLIIGVPLLLLLVGTYRGYSRYDVIKGDTEHRAGQASCDRNAYTTDAYCHMDAPYHQPHADTSAGNACFHDYPLASPYTYTYHATLCSAEWRYAAMP